MNIYVFIVVHNIECGDSITCNSIPCNENTKIHVIDNSTVPNRNAQYCAGRGWAYIPLAGNPGLSKAYNRALDEVRGKQGYVVWFDDDTTVCPNYFESLLANAQANPETGVFLPIVSDGDSLLSPSRMKRFLSHPVRSITEIPDREITGINSGMAINLDAVRSYRYDEGLFLDCVDHQFIHDMKHDGRSIRVMADTELSQRFSGTQKDIPWPAVAARFRTFRRDYMHFCRRYPFGRMYAYIYLLIRYIRLWLRRS